MRKMASSYKLLITVETDPPKKYKELLSECETTTGLPTAFRNKIKNVGKNPFLGGEIVDKTIYFETSFGTVNYSQSITVAPSKIGSIEPGETDQIIGTWTIPFPGPWRMMMGIEATDKKKIDFYQYQGGSPTDKWFGIFYAVGRHQLDLALLLKALLNKR